MATVKFRTTRKFAAAARAVAAFEGRTLASLARSSLAAYCRPRLPQLESDAQPASRSSRS